MERGKFDEWVAQVKGNATPLDRATYLKLEKPSEKEPVRRYAQVEPNLFDRVVNLCVEPGKMCMHDMMAIDAKGGLGLAGAYNVRDLAYDKFAARGTLAGAHHALCRRRLHDADGPATAPDPTPVDSAPLTGAGLSRVRQSTPPSARTAMTDIPVLPES
jgi:cytochrome o ubiquinol oxidase subunit 2